MTNAAPASASTSSRGDQRLIDAAADLLATRYEGEITGSEIAAAVGVDHTLINHHFGSTARLLSIATTQLVKSEYLTWMDVVQSLRDSSDTADDFERLIASLALNMDGRHHRRLARLAVARFADFQSDPYIASVFASAIMELTGRIEAFSRDDIARGWTDSKFPVRAFAFFHLAHALSLAICTPDSNAAQLQEHHRFVGAFRMADYRRLLDPEARPPLRGSTNTAAAASSLTFKALDRQRRRIRVLETVVSLVEQKGPLAVRMRDVADLSHESIATIYRWFTSREQLLAAAGEHQLNKLHARILITIDDCARREATDIERLQVFKTLRWEATALLALHNPEEGFDLFTAPRYLELRALATTLIGPDGVDEFSYFAETLWLSEILAEIAGIKIDPVEELELVRRINALFLTQSHGDFVV